MFPPSSTEINSTEPGNIGKYSKNNYDLVIDAQGLIKSAIVAKLLGFETVLHYGSMEWFSNGVNGNLVENKFNNLF